MLTLQSGSTATLSSVNFLFVVFLSEPTKGNYLEIIRNQFKRLNADLYI